MDAAGKQEYRNATAAQWQLVGEHQQHLAKLDAKLTMFTNALSPAFIAV